MNIGCLYSTYVYSQLHVLTLKPSVYSQFTHTKTFCLLSVTCTHTKTFCLLPVTCTHTKTFCLLPVTCTHTKTLFSTSTPQLSCIYDMLYYIYILCVCV